MHRATAADHYARAERRAVERGPNTEPREDNRRTGRAIEDLPRVAADYVSDQTGALQPATIRNRMAYLRAACRYAWRAHGMADADPGARMVLPEVRNARHLYLTRAQMIALARACRQWETRAMIRVAFYTGWRFSEIARARVEGDRLVLDDSKNSRPRAMLRDTLREALTEAYMMGAQNILGRM